MKSEHKKIKKNEGQIILFFYESTSFMQNKETSWPFVAYGATEAFNFVCLFRAATTLNHSVFVPEVKIKWNIQICWNVICCIKFLIPLWTARIRTICTLVISILKYANFHPLYSTIYSCLFALRVFRVKLTKFYWILSEMVLN